MKGDWRVGTLDAAADFLSGATPSKARPDYWGGHIPWVSAKDMKKRRLRDTEDYITAAGLENGSRVAPAGATLVLVRGMTLLTDVPICAVETDVAFNQDIKAIVPRDEVDASYLNYALLAAKAQLLSMIELAGHGTGRLPTDRLRALKIPLPPKSEQRAIAHTLGMLDDKIELNRRMNETLEAIARAVFKAWFVDFEPVRAKVEGRWRRGESLPGLPARLYELFPDRLVDSELGEIPEGWEIGRLGELLEQRVERCGASAETAARPYVPIDCISPKSLFLTESKPGAEAQSSLTRFYKGDLLFGAMRPYFHKVCIAPFDGTTRTTAFVLASRRREDFSFVTVLLHQPNTIDYATRHSTGSTIPYAVWSNSLENMPIILSPLRVREAFDEIERPVLERIPERYFENKTLAAVSDALLPKLISGELRVKDAENSIATSASLAEPKG